MAARIDLHTLRGLPVIVGAGVAGLMTALHFGDKPCVLVSCAEPPGVGALPYGVAAALGADDTPADRARHTLERADGLASLETVQRITGAMASVVDTLGQFGITIKAGSHDSGFALHAALLAAVHARPNVTIIAPTAVRRLIVVDGHVRGIALNAGERSVTLDSDAVILASGGTCGLYSDGLGPRTAAGSGLAVAARAGVVLSDLEFVHFHPFALSLGDTPGSGLAIPFGLYGPDAMLLDEQGQKLEGDISDPAYVARAIFARKTEGHAVFLDLRKIVASDEKKDGSILKSFLSVCHARGIDPATQALPVRPAPAFHMGGIRTDASGRTSLPGLWACGEVASTGFHGASVYDGNPLLEAVVCSRFVAENVTGRMPAPFRDVSGIRPEQSLPRGLLPVVRKVMSTAMAPMRTETMLTDALMRISRFADYDDVALIAQMMLVSALRRRESRGAHFRSDFPAADTVAKRVSLTADEVRTAVRLIGRDHPVTWSLDGVTQINPLNA
ncbi:FAD-binding protein [Acetobacter fallax]|uniref:L-aspartate oxidase n=1 Tax=Acetobacter fallax TaxID=1737473 RepID=A0ABX0K9K4_9PROT|nr:FAD-binding protein [Acetobacter fallax]NHO31215.1 FAD-binding protein [Acetobacter fallax]NHO34772.1 FAD-binding protein [Acetobacter fallax]